MVLKLLYDKQDDIPEAHRELFTEEGGKWKLTAVEGLKTADDVTRLQKSLQAAQADNKTLKAAVKAFEPLGKPEEIEAKLNRVEELESLIEASKAGGDEKKVEEVVTRRVDAVLKAKTAQMERELKKLQDANATLVQERDGLAGEKKHRKLTDELRAAALHKDVGIQPEALDDVLLLGERVFEIAEGGKVLTRDNVGVTPGLTAKDWLDDLKNNGKKPHWFPASKGGGARGGSGDKAGGGVNPWSNEHWNLTAQGAVLRERGEATAKRMAEAAGTTLGGMRPKKPTK